MKRLKRWFVMLMSMVLILGLTGCGDDNKRLFNVNQEPLTYIQTLAYGYIYAYEYRIVDQKQLEDIYEDNKTYNMFYKEQMREGIIRMLLFYHEAKEGDIVLTDGQKEEVKEKAKAVVKEYGKKNLSKHNITKNHIEEIYEMRMLADAYIETLSKEDKKESETSRYVQVFQAIFPTIELDDNGMVMSSGDGNVKEISQEEKEEKQIEAQDYANQVHDGKDMKTLLKDYDKTVTGTELYLKYDDLKGEYKKAVDDLKQGESSDAFLGEYGYYVIRLLNEDATDYAAALTVYEDNVKQSDIEEQELKKLYNLYITNNKEYIDESLWNTITMEDFVL